MPCSVNSDGLSHRAKRLSEPAWACSREGTALKEEVGARALRKENDQVEDTDSFNSYFLSI